MLLKDFFNFIHDSVTYGNWVMILQRGYGDPGDSVSKSLCLFEFTLMNPPVSRSTPGGANRIYMEPLRHGDFVFNLFKKS